MPSSNTCVYITELAKVIPAADNLPWNRTHSLEDTRRPANLSLFKDNRFWSNEDSSNNHDNSGHSETTTHDYKQ